MSSATTTTIRLLGQPKLKDHLSFITDSVVDGENLVKSDQVDQWRRANDYYFELEEKEANLANTIDVNSLDSALQGVADETAQDPRYKFTFDKFPTSFAMVELDKLVVSQLFINSVFSQSLQTSLNPKPELEALFRFCLPPETPEHTVKTRKASSGRYIFTSESSDFRTHRVAMLAPDQVKDFDTFGPVSGLVGMAVGFGSNFLTGIQAEDRILLHNGYHRAHALRAAGITHAPCILQTVTRLDELEIAVKSSVAADPNYYFGSPRPPMLKDFFDSNIRREYSTYKTVKKVEVNIDFNEYYERL